MLAIGILVVGIGLPAGAAHADPASDFVSRTNALRASKGIAPLGVDSRLTSIAQRWASHMASTQTLAHNPDLANEIPSDWEKYGENVGTGPSVDAIQQAFVNSPHHYANLVDPDFTLIGVAVVIDSRGALWVVEDFLLEGYVPPPTPPPRQQSPPLTAAPPAPQTLPPPTTSATTTTTTMPTTTVQPSAADVAAALRALDARS